MSFCTFPIFKIIIHKQLRNMSLKGIKLVTFDATNTLLKFRVPSWQYYTLVARNYGFTGNEEVVKCRLADSYKIMWNSYPNFGKFKITWREWWSQVVKKTFEGQLPASTDIDIIANKLIDEFKTSKCWCVAPAGLKLLNLLRNQDLKIGVISNFDPHLIEIFQSVEIVHYFDFILTSYDVGYSKPDKRIFSHALEQCKTPIKSSEALHIGDDFYKDYEGAKASGWHAVLVCSSNISKRPPEIRNVFESLEELRLAIDLNKIVL